MEESQGGPMKRYRILKGTGVRLHYPAGPSVMYMLDKTLIFDEADCGEETQRSIMFRCPMNTHNISGVECDRDKIEVL